MTQYDDVNTPMLAMVGFLGSVLVFAIIVFLTVLYHMEQDRQDYVKKVNQPFTELETQLASQRIKLAEYRWVDEKKQVVAIPIDRAMELVVQQNRSQKGPSPQGGTAEKGDRDG